MPHNTVIRGTGDAQLAHEQSERLLRIARALETDLAGLVVPPDRVADIKERIHRCREDATELLRKIAQFDGY
jgi:hypothetical protein